jgi:sensor histidine kinase YesM
MQLPSATNTEKWAAIAAALGGIIAALKKFTSRKAHKEPITRAEFHQQLDSIRDRITASYMALSEKLDQHQEQNTTRFDALESRIECRLDHLEQSVARLDERTKTL